jgi:hypothetical protein
MRKIPQEYDNPLDNYFIGLSEITTPYAYSIGMNPNMITTLSNIACIITILLLLNANYYLAAFFVLVSYYFDCMDGHMARKYDMVTIFGDYYDHISDSLKIFAILFTLYFINKEKFMKVIPIIILLFILMSVHLGCQELLYNSNESATLEHTKLLCPVDNNSNSNLIKNTLLGTKYFGCGTFFIGLALIIIYYGF